MTDSEWEAGPSTCKNCGKTIRYHRDYEVWMDRHGEAGCAHSPDGHEEVGA